MSPQLFKTIELGPLNLAHRIVLAPLTRYRADDEHVPKMPLVKDYYSQRSSIPGTFLLTEATFISAKGSGFTNVPGIWSPKQIAAWKEVVESVHINGSHIFLQVWALGRSAIGKELKLDDPSFEVVAPSSIPLSYKPEPVRELTIAELEEYKADFAQAAKNAVFEAGFDGVEINSVNGFFLDQMLQDVTNQRTDKYGGSVEGRSRFGLEVVDAVVEAIGAERTAIRLSPWSHFQEMGMKDPVPQFSHFVANLKANHPNLAYLHVIESRVNGIDGIGNRDLARDHKHESNKFIRDIWSPKKLITAGGFTREQAIAFAEETGSLIAFGRHFIANPDLPLRLMENIALTPYDRSTFFTHTEVGYNDYPFSEEFKNRKATSSRIEVGYTDHQNRKASIRQF